MQNLVFSQKLLFHQTKELLLRLNALTLTAKKMTFARSALSTSLHLFDERKCLHLILAAPTFGYFHFGYLNKWRDL